MWFCPKCGNKNEDSCSFCPGCGTPNPLKTADAQPVQEQVPAQKAPAPEKAPGKRKKLLTVAISAMVIAAVVLILALGGSNGKKEAEKLAEEGSYAEAYEEMTVYLEEKDRTPADYRQAAEYAKASGKWEEVLEILDKADYTDSEKNGVKDECNYYLALAAMEEDDWEEAEELLEGNGYADSAEKYEETMLHTHCDYDFLEALEKALTASMGVDAKDFSDYLDAIAEEYQAIEQYSEGIFHQERLAELANAYILNLGNRLHTCNRLSNDEIWIWGYQANLWPQKLEAAEILSDLREEFGFMADNKEFTEAYVDGLEELQEQVNIVNAFKDSFYNSRSKKSSSGWRGNDHQFIRYTNDTGYYLPSVTFFFICYDKNNLQTENDIVTMELPINKRVDIEFKCSANISKYWTWDWYINF